MAYNPKFQPQPIGMVTVAVPGTPVQLISTLILQGIVDEATDLVECNQVAINAIPPTGELAGNQGAVYIGQQSMNKATLEGVIVVLLPTQGVPYINNVGLNTLHFRDWYVDADTAGDGVYGSITQA